MKSRRDIQRATRISFNKVILRNSVCCHVLCGAQKAPPHFVRKLRRYMQGLRMKYVPNKIPLGERMINKIFSVILVIYGGYGIYVNDLYLPSKRGSGVHLHDEPALLMYASFICGCLVMLSVVVDHYDERDNEHKYQSFAKCFKFLGWGIFGFSLIWSLVKLSI